MKKLMTIALAATMLAACGQKKDAPKVLVLYYSQTSNTKVVAVHLANRWRTCSFVQRLWPLWIVLIVLAIIAIGVLTYHAPNWIIFADLG